MLVVILGAGASADALGPDSPHPSAVPPLTDQLFNSSARPDARGVMSLFPEGAGAFDEVRRRLGGSSESDARTVEGELRRLRDAAEADPAILVELLALQCYLRRLLWDCGQNVLGADASITNYVTLVRALERWRAGKGVRVDWVTFNYDVLLEKALESTALASFDSIEQYVTEDRGVFKVHGSVDWGRIVVHPTLAQKAANDVRALIRAARELEWTTEYVKKWTNNEIRDGDVVYAPAIAIPVEEKSEYECPASHMEELERRLAAAEIILTIGWRARDQDFLDRIGVTVRPDAFVEIVTKTEHGASEVEARLRGVGLKGPFNRVAGGFSDWIGSPLSEFLETCTTTLEFRSETRESEPRVSATSSASELDAAVTEGNEAAVGDHDVVEQVDFQKPVRTPMSCPPSAIRPRRST